MSTHTLAGWTVGMAICQMMVMQLIMPTETRSYQRNLETSTNYVFVALRILIDIKKVFLQMKNY